MDRPGNSVGQKRRGRPFNPHGIDPVISFRMDYHLEKELDRHHARPAPRAKLHAGGFLRDEKASSGHAGADRTFLRF
jgi:hypothetical protein